MIAHKKKGLVKRNLFQVGIKDPSEKGSEYKGRYNKF
jgi:hypothetical protein